MSQIVVGMSSKFIDLSYRRNLGSGSSGRSWGRSRTTTNSGRPKQWRGSTPFRRSAGCSTQLRSPTFSMASWTTCSWTWRFRTRARTSRRSLWLLRFSSSPSLFSTSSVAFFDSSGSTLSVPSWTSARTSSCRSWRSGCWFDTTGSTWMSWRASTRLRCSFGRGFVHRCFLSAALRSNAADYVLSLFIFFIFFIQLSFSKTTGPILTKFSGIVYSGVVWIIR